MLPLNWLSTVRLVKVPPKPVLEGADAAAGQNDVAAEIRELIATTAELAGKAEVSFPYDTAAFSCVRLS